MITANYVGADTSIKVYSRTFTAPSEQYMRCEYIRKNHENAHGLHKGFASYATSGIISPSIASIASRGYWSMGAVLAIY